MLGLSVRSFFCGAVDRASAAVTGTVSATLNELDAGQRVSAAYRLVGRNGPALAGATAVQFMVIAVLVLTVIGIPLAVYYFIRTSLFAQACVLEDETAIAQRAPARG